MNVLFICQGNINRSPSAEAVFRSLIPDAEVSSAGVFADRAGEPLSAIPGGSVEIMRELGFDISSHIVRQLTPDIAQGAHRIVVMGEIPQGPLPEYLAALPRLEMWDIPDPGYGAITLREARDRVIERVHAFAKQVQLRS